MYKYQLSQPVVVQSSPDRIVRTGRVMGYATVFANDGSVHAQYIVRLNEGFYSDDEQTFVQDILVDESAMKGLNENV